ncbi:MAG: DUF2723 domain-containing protein [Clostridium sp.]|nr:DUF2723 domain-containing protein [Clostridium sp.]
MKQFKLVDSLMGWITFAIAAFVYCSTIEPTASFWDCPEFITTAYKLEVGHPPGAPFFMLTANLFSQFVDDPTQVARMVNLMSALFSAGCILFLFWSITHLTRKLVSPVGQVMTLGRLIVIEGSGLVGALVYTFSDTFWFSAVEGEVYAYSSLFTALVFWLILKWEEHADEPHSDRWLILIAYLTGLSIGVHLLNLLCLPALVLVYYYRRNPKANLKGSLMALFASVVLVAVVLYGIVPGIVKVGGWFELFFVNFLGFSFNVGLVIYIICLITVVLWAIRETFVLHSRLRMNISYMCTLAMLGIPFYGYGWSSLFVGMVVLALVAVVLFYKREGKHLISARVMNTSLLCMLMIMVGYSSYAVIVIRSTANTPMDQNSPEDIFTLGTYLNREQYGKTPLFYGPAYTSQMKLKAADGYCVPVSKQGAPVYQRVEKRTADEKDAYEIIRYDQDYQYAQNMLFPRMHSSAHGRAYEDWMGGVDGKNVLYDRCGETITVKVPTQMENLRFFISYQLNFMYWRYFLWNFAGRQNDIQGNGEIEHGNWLSGIPMIDNLRLGDQDKLPSDLRNNKGHNVYYCLPLLLGLLGLFWQAYKNEEGTKQFWVVFFLFFMTGIAIVLYLNQTPMQPRERDYAYAGSFYAYAIWVGMGVAALADGLRRLRVQETVAASLVSLVCLAVPVQMAAQNWDDHDRSNRYTCRDFGQNYLQSLPQDGCPIIFTNGDNDTFPLWYNQETEGFRTDVRVCNFSYLQTDWYIDQMKRPAYDSPSVPISWSRLQYVGGTREGVQIHPEALSGVIDYYCEVADSAAMKEALGENPYELRNIIDRWVLNEDANLQIIPTDSIVLTVDKEAVKRSGMMIAADSIPDVMHISLKGRRVIYKSELMMLEMLASSNWERPLYIATTVGSDNYGDMGKNFVQEGLANRITPFNTEESGRRVDTGRMYDNLMNRFKFGGLDTPGIYLDETVMRMCYTHRRLFAQLVAELLREGKTDKALKALAYAEQMIPESSVPHNYQSGSLTLARSWFMLNKIAEGSKIYDAVARNSMEYLDWYLSLSDKRFFNSSDDCMYHLYLLSDIAQAYDKIDPKKAEEYTKILNDYEQRCYSRGMRM